MKTKYFILSVICTLVIQTKAAVTAVNSAVAVEMTEEDYKNATGDDVADLLDINLV